MKNIMSIDSGLSGQSHGVIVDTLLYGSKK